MGFIDDLVQQLKDKVAGAIDEVNLKQQIEDYIASQSNPPSNLSTNPVIILKTKDQKVNNQGGDTGLVDDNELRVWMEANEIAMIDVHLIQESESTAPKFKAAWFVGSGLAEILSGTEFGWGGYSHQDLQPANRSLYFETDNVTQGIHYTSIVKKDNVAGNLIVAWCQENPTPEDTWVLAGSNLIKYRLK